ncbi:DEAD/DEAH box helicase [Staphylococcus edaphicus]|uniref:ATPase n=1 Tax=Staphylococcus edaphicus TaxID=1955013 RepID=A0A2C6WLY2_9STAP|nr:DEAD/DEAH box helicase [Staphylococcus edaphicus]PHK50110.1 ATPase [Staphylococcus edaphicus]UQW81604.1 DNA2/NAM7 family helicase [Staphylococcus edaphicus]
MGHLVKDTLSAWLLLESLSPGEVTYTTEDTLSANHFRNESKQKQLQSFNEYFDIWMDKRFIISNEKKVKGKRIFKFYRNCFRYKEINLKIQDIFDSHLEIYNPNTTHCYGYTFNTDENGKVIADSLHIPMIMSALKEIERDKNANIEAQFNDSVEKFLQKVNEIVADEPINEQKLEKMDKAYDKYFSVLNSKNNGLFRHYIAIEFVKNNELPRPEFNSFFISDIEMAKNGPNQTLVDYIEGLEEDQRIEVDENKELIEQFLHPSQLPDGRWPSQTEFRLSLMQQVAVNQITSSDKKISSVNGPPGTGKTTLLKEVFAHIVVERGKELAKLENPKSAFNPQKLHETDEKEVYLLKEAISKYKMVVASSNNGAVENISKDLPKLEEIIREPEHCAFPEYEKDYAGLAQELDSFAEIAGDLIGEDAWGLFSGVFGKSKNINEVLHHLLKQDKDAIDFAKMLQNENNNFSVQELMKEWKTQKELFLEELKNVEKLKKESIKAFEVYKDYEQAINKENSLKAEKQTVKNNIQKIKNEIDKGNEALIGIDKQINHHDNQLDVINDLLQSIKERNKGLVNKLKAMFSAEEDEQFQKYNKERQQLLTQKLDLEKAKMAKQDDIDSNNEKQESLNNKLLKIQKEVEDVNHKVQVFEAFRNESNITIPSKDFWSKTNYDERQISNLWTSDELQYRRAMLFLRAMMLHKLLLIANNTSVYHAIKDFKDRRKLIDTKPELVYNAWNVIHLIFPIVSTTFASFKAMYQGIPKDFIDYLFIDEAGQAVPQAAVGALYRSKKVTVVGDPIQIEPVVTLESHLIDNIRKNYNVPERLVSKEASVQSVADHANYYGYWKKDVTGKSQKIWIGIPLWVHRRCLNPMFTVANQIAYNNKMVLPSNVEEIGRIGWHNVIGTSTQKQYVKEHGEKLLELVVNDWNKAIKANQIEPNSFVISPFSAVQQQIRRLVKSQLPTKINVERERINNWVNKSIGTVHTFQGKEAHKVYFVVGTDNTQDGAVNWSCEKPNLLNVAVTRAKKEFYVIGDLRRIQTKPFYEIINKEKNVDQ